MKSKVITGLLLTLFLIGMLTLAFDIQPAKASYAVEEGRIGTIHWGSGVVKDSNFINFGTGDIFWSIASEERGYFYGSSYSTPTVFFADKIEDYWGSLDSYRGVQHIWEFTNASDHEWFTQHSITFAEETSPYYTGILLIQQGGLYGAIKPKSIHNGDINHPEDYLLEFDWWYDDSGGSDFSPLKPTATIDIHPQTFNLRSKGKWVTAYIELPEGYNVSDIDVPAILLNDTLRVDLGAPTDIGDYDNDSIQDLMVKFNRSDVISLLNVGNQTVKVTGQLKNGIPFEGTDTIRAIHHRSHLFARLVELGIEWAYASTSERSAIFKEIAEIDSEWS